MLENSDRTADPGEFPLSPEQVRLLRAKKVTARGADLMNIHSVICVDGFIDPIALGKAFAQLCIDNDMLRTRLVVRPDGPRQAIFPAEPRLQIISDYQDRKVRDIEEIRKHVSDLVWQEFDLERDVLIRGFLVSLSDKEHIFGIVTNLLVTDGTSHLIIWKFIKDWYAHFASAGPQPKYGKHSSYADFVAERIRWEEQDAARDIPYWQSHFDGLQPVVVGETARPSSQEPYFVYALSKEDLTKLQKFAIRQRMTFFVILLTVCFCFLFRFSKEEKAAVTVGRDGRNRPGYFAAIGKFALACPMSAHRPHGLTLGEFLLQVRGRWAEAVSRPWIPSKLDGRGFAAIPLFVSYIEVDVFTWESGAGEHAQSFGVSKFPILPAPNHKAQGVPSIWFSNTRDGLEISLLQPEPKFQYFESEVIVRNIKEMLSAFIESCEMPCEDFIRGGQLKN